MKTITGNIKDFSFPKILVYLNRYRKTGALTINTPTFTKKVYLNKGNIIFASSTAEDDRLGETLIKIRKITVDQYDRSVELLKSTGKRQGTILVELGYLTPQDLVWSVKYQVKEIIHSLFQIEDAEFEFEEEEIPSNEAITLQMRMGNIIHEGVRSMKNFTRIVKDMPDMNSRLRLNEDSVTLFQEMVLSPRDKHILSMVDGKRTINEIINSSLEGSFSALETLYILYVIGVLTEQKEKIEEARKTVSLEEILATVPEEKGEQESLSTQKSIITDTSDETKLSIQDAGSQKSSDIAEAYIQQELPPEKEEVPQREVPQTKRVMTQHLIILLIAVAFIASALSFVFFTMPKKQPSLSYQSKAQIEDSKETKRNTLHTLELITLKRMIADTTLMSKQVNEKTLKKMFLNPKERNKLIVKKGFLSNIDYAGRFTLLPILKADEKKIESIRSKKQNSKVKTPASKKRGERQRSKE